MPLDSTKSRAIHRTFLVDQAGSQIPRELRQRWGVMGTRFDQSALTEQQSFDVSAEMTYLLAATQFATSTRERTLSFVRM